jgi:transcription elongation factor GreA
MYAFEAVSSHHSVPVTPEGHRRLKELLHELTTTGRAELSARLRDARHDGRDPADNPELMDALDEQARLERRIGELSSRLARATVVTGGMRADGRAALGTRVRLRPLTRPVSPVEYELVSSVEANPSLGLLSAESPLGGELLGRRAGETIEVRAPRGPIRFAIVSVEDAAADYALAA